MGFFEDEALLDFDDEELDVDLELDFDLDLEFDLDLDDDFDPGLLVDPLDLDPPDFVVVELVFEAGGELGAA